LRKHKPRFDKGFSQNWRPNCSGYRIQVK
jgi:hypothetical protein